MKQPQTFPINQPAPIAVGLQRLVRTPDQRLYTFFLKDESIHEIKATDAEAALQMLGEKLEKPAWFYRYWLLQEIVTCLTPI
jgi:hypothetical protein